jgi:hypothetical protein
MVIDRAICAGVAPDNHAEAGRRTASANRNRRLIIRASLTDLLCCDTHFIAIASNPRMNLAIFRNGLFIAILAHSVIGVSLVWDKVLLPTRMLISKREQHHP